MTLNKALEEVESNQDEAIAMEAFLNSKQERLDRMVKEEAEEKMVKAIFERRNNKGP